jgi:hypothetical protein
MSHLIFLIDSLRDRERAAAELYALQVESAERPRLYRLMYVPPRQRQDVEMSCWLSRWLCEYFSKGNLE